MAVEQCFPYVRKKWNRAYPNNPLTTDAHTGPELWDIAMDAGYTASTGPEPNSVACYDDGGDGHVAWVLRDNGDGTMDISESNWPDENNPDNWSAANRTVEIGARGKNGRYKLLGFVFYEED